MTSLAHPRPTLETIQKLDGEDLKALGRQLAEAFFPSFSFKHIGGPTWAAPDAENPEIRFACTVIKSGFGSCACGLFEERGDCEHVQGVKFLQRKTATCCGCGARCWNTDLVEVQEEDSLTHFAGDTICRACADGAAVAY